MVVGTFFWSKRCMERFVGLNDGYDVRLRPVRLLLLEGGIGVIVLCNKAKLSEIRRGYEAMVVTQGREEEDGF